MGGLKYAMSSGETGNPDGMEIATEVDPTVKQSGNAKLCTNSHVPPDWTVSQLKPPTSRATTSSSGNANCFRVAVRPSVWSLGKVVNLSTPATAKSTMT